MKMSRLVITTQQSIVTIGERRPDFRIFKIRQRQEFYMKTAQSGYVNLKENVLFIYLAQPGLSVAALRL